MIYLVIHQYTEFLAFMTTDLYYGTSITNSNVELSADSREGRRGETEKISGWEIYLVSLQPVTLLC